MVNGQPLIGRATPSILNLPQLPKLSEAEARSITIGIPAEREITEREARIESISQVESSIGSLERGVQNVEKVRQTKLRQIRENPSLSPERRALEIRDRNREAQQETQSLQQRIGELTQQRESLRAQRVQVTRAERQIARLLPEAARRELEEQRGPGRGRPLEIVTAELIQQFPGAKLPGMEIRREEAIITPIGRPTKDQLFTERAGEILTGSLAEIGRGISGLVPIKTEPTTRVISQVVLGPEEELIFERPILVPTKREILESPLGIERVGPFITPIPTIGRLIVEEAVRETGRILEIPEQILAITPEQIEKQGLELQRLVETREIGTEFLGVIERAVTERPLETAVGLGLLISAPRVIARARAPKVTRTIDLGRIEATVIGEEITGVRTGVSVFQAGRKEFLVTDIGTFAGRVTPDVTFTLGKGGFAIQRIGRRGLSRPKFGRIETKEVAERITKEGQELIRSISVSELDVGRRTILGEAAEVARETQRITRAFDGRVETGLTLEAVGARAVERGPTVGIGRTTVRITEFAPIEDLGVSIVSPRQLRQIAPPTGAGTSLEKAVADLIKSTEATRIEFGVRTAITPEIFGEIFGPRAGVTPRIEEQQIISTEAEALRVERGGIQIPIEIQRETVLTEFDELVREKERITTRLIGKELQAPFKGILQAPRLGQIQEIGIGQIQEPGIIQLQEPRVAQIQEPRVTTELEAPRLTSPPFGIPLLLPPRRGPRREDFPEIGLDEPGFFVEVKRKGKFKKVRSKPLTERGALGLGSKLVDESAAASFRIRPADKKAESSRFEGIFTNLKNQFRDPIRKGKKVKGTGILIEKRKFRLDTPGELRAIQKKGARAPRKKKGSKKSQDIFDLDIGL